MNATDHPIPIWRKLLARRGVHIRQGDRSHQLFARMAAGGEIPDDLKPMLRHLKPLILDDLHARDQGERRSR